MTLCEDVIVRTERFECYSHGKNDHFRAFLTVSRSFSLVLVSPNKNVVSSNGLVGGLTNGQTDERTNGRTDGRTDGRTQLLMETPLERRYLNICLLRVSTFHFLSTPLFYIFEREFRTKFFLIFFFKENLRFFNLFHKKKEK